MCARVVNSSGISSAATLEMWKYEVVNYTTPEGLSGSTLREVRGQYVEKRKWRYFSRV